MTDKTYEIKLTIAGGIGTEISFSDGTTYTVNEPIFRRIKKYMENSIYMKKRKTGWSLAKRI